MSVVCIVKSAGSPNLAPLGAILFTKIAYFVKHVIGAKLDPNVLNIVLES